MNLNRCITRARVKFWTGAIAFCGLMPAGWYYLPVSAQTVPEQHEPDRSTASLFKALNRQSHWTLVSRQQLAFEAWHPQGLTAAAGRYYLSTVEILQRTTRLNDAAAEDRTAGKGRGHLICFDNAGEKLQAIELGAGDMYHPGGIDRDEHFIWVPVAEYRPSSRSIIYQVSLDDFTAHEVFRFPDHIGAVIRDVERNRLIGFSWGGRRIYSWQLDEQGKLKNAEDAPHRSHTLTPQHYIDYQDCQFVGSGLALCSGLATYSLPEDRRFSLGGIELIEVASGRPIHQLPVELYTDGNPARIMTQNPCYVEKSPTGLRFHFIPEDGVSHHYVYEVQAIVPEKVTKP